MQPKDFFEKLLTQYEGYFDIERPHIFDGREILAYARFKRRASRYLMVQRAQLYATEVFEHVFFVHVPKLDEAAWQQEKARIFAAEQAYVSPNSEHMYSYMTLILICDTIDEACILDIRRLRHTKNYRFSLQGYSTVRVAAVDLSSGTIVCNRQAKELKAVLERAYQ